MKPLVACLVGAALCIAAIPAGAQSGDGAEHYQRGAALYADGDYREAAAAFRVAFDENDSSQYLFAWAQAERLADNCSVAVDLYRRLLDRGVSEAQRELIVEALSLCGAEPQPEPEPQPPPEPAPVVIAPPPPEPAPPSRLGPIALGAVGLVGLGVGTGFYVSGRAAARAEAATSDDHAANAARAERNQRIGVASAATGATLVAGAIAWWLLADGSEESDRRVAAWVDGEGGGLQVWGRF